MGDFSFSIRKFMALIFSVTYCMVILACTVALFKKIITVETYLALIGTFVLIVREITDAYYKRSDRNQDTTTSVETTVTPAVEPPKEVTK